MQPNHIRHKPQTALTRERELILACPQFRSGVNLSRIVRLAGCAGIRQMTVCGNTKIDAKIARDATGFVEIERHRTLANWLKKIRSESFHVVALEQVDRSQNLFDYRFQRNTVLLIGHERLGVSAEELSLADDEIEIPIYDQPFSSSCGVNLMTQNLYETPDDLTTGAKQTAGSSSCDRRLLIIGGLLLFAIVMIGVLIPPVQSPRGPAKRTVCSNWMRQLALAMLNYESVHGHFPPAYTVDENGRPLHSWRAQILPYVEQRAVYDSIDFSKPWDDPVNKKAYETDVEGFRCPESKAPNGFTTYLALVTPNSCLRPKESCVIADIQDGTSNTVTIIEVPVSSAVHWMSPFDADEGLFLRIGETGFQSPHSGGFNAVRGDGSVYFLRNNTPADVRRALISVAGNDNEVLEDKLK